MCCCRLIFLPRYAEGFNFTRNSFSRWRTLENKEMSTEVGWFRKTKESEEGAYTKFLNMFVTLYSRRLYSSLLFRWWSYKLAIHAKGYTLWNRNNCCAISSCRSGDKNTSGHRKCRLERAIRMREYLSNASNFLIYLYCERKASEIFIFHFFRRSKVRKRGCRTTET